MVSRLSIFAAGCLSIHAVLAESVCKDTYCKCYQVPAVCHGSDVSCAEECGGIPTTTGSIITTTAPSTTPGSTTTPSTTKSTQPATTSSTTQSTTTRRTTVLSSTSSSTTASTTLSPSTAATTSAVSTTSGPTVATGCPGNFYDDFSNGLSSDRWRLMYKWWGSVNHGINPKLVSLENANVFGVQKKVVRLHTTGDLYTGTSIQGVKRDGGKYVFDPDNRTRVGSGICTVNEWASGEYEVVMKIPNEALAKGMAPSIWTFHYEEHGAGADQNSPNTNDLLYRVADKVKLDDGTWYSNVNSEIDFPEFGYNGDFTTAMYTSYTAFTDYESPKNTYTTHKDLQNGGKSIADGQWHTIKMVWRTQLRPTTCSVVLAEAKQGGHLYCAEKGHEDQGRAVTKNARGVFSHQGKEIDFFVDGKLTETFTDANYISAVNARVCVVGWGPKWVKAANWAESDFWVSSVKITPLNDEGDVCWQRESFPTDGLVRPDQYGF